MENVISKKGFSTLFIQDLLKEYLQGNLSSENFTHKLNTYSFSSVNVEVVTKEKYNELLNQISLIKRDKELKEKRLSDENYYYNKFLDLKVEFSKLRKNRDYYKRTLKIWVDKYKNK